MKINPDTKEVLLRHFEEKTYPEDMSFFFEIDDTDFLRVFTCLTKHKKSEAIFDKWRKKHDRFMSGEKFDFIIFYTSLSRDLCFRKSFEDKLKAQEEVKEILKVGTYLTIKRLRQEIIDYLDSSQMISQILNDISKQDEFLTHQPPVEED